MAAGRRDRDESLEREMTNEKKSRGILRGRSLIHPGRKPSSVLHPPIGAMLSVVSAITIAKRKNT
jgi:hypothetical protein